MKNMKDKIKEKCKLLFNKKNKKAVSRGPSMTWFMIGIVVFVGVVALVYEPHWGIYNNFMADNGGTAVNSQYSSAYQNITAVSGNLSLWQENLTINSITSVPLALASAVMNTFAIGFSAIRTFSQLPNFFNSIFNVIQTTIGIPAALLWIISSVVTIYFASKFVKGLRGTIDDI